MLFRSNLGSFSSALVANPSLPAQSVREVFDLARTKPGELTMGTFGVTHLYLAWLKKEKGVALYDVPYKTAAQTLAGAVSGDLHLAVFSAGGVITLAKSGKVRVLAVTGEKRSPFLPEVPTFREAGIELEIPAWFGMFAPAGTPAAVVARLNLEFNKAIADSRMREQLLDPYDVEFGVMNPLSPSGQGEMNMELSASLATASNEWQLEKWARPEPRLKASIVVPYEDPAAAVAEIRRRAGDKHFCQVLLMSRTNEALGRKKYWPIYEAAVDAGARIDVIDARVERQVCADPRHGIGTVAKRHVVTPAVGPESQPAARRRFNTRGVPHPSVADLVMRVLAPHHACIGRDAVHDAVFEGALDLHTRLSFAAPGERHGNTTAWPQLIHEAHAGAVRESVAVLRMHHRQEHAALPKRFQRTGREVERIHPRLLVDDDHDQDVVWVLDRAKTLPHVNAVEAATVLQAHLDPGDQFRCRGLAHDAADQGEHVAVRRGVIAVDADFADDADGLLRGGDTGAEQDEHERADHLIL